MGKSASEVRADIEDTRREMSDTIDAIADRTSPRRMVQRRRRAMADGWRSVQERVMGRAESASSAAGDGARHLSESARDTAGSVVDTARQVPDTVVSQTQGNPMAVGLVAFGAGLLAATLIPPSAPEQRLAGTLRDQAQPLQDELKAAGQQVVEDVKSSAQEGAEQVKQRASEAAGTVQEDVKSSAQEVRSQAQR
jgi:gas vesicle protein